MKHKPTRIPIVVDSWVRLPDCPASQKAMTSLRRHLRRLGGSVPPGPLTTDDLINQLTRQADNQIQLFQGLLPQLTDILARQDTPYDILDQREVASEAITLRVPDDRPWLADALRRLMLRENGIVVAANPDDRLLIACAMMSRRRNRTLWLTSSRQRAQQAMDHVRLLAGGVGPTVSIFDPKDSQTPVTFCSYHDFVNYSAGTKQSPFGFTIFDDLSQTIGQSIFSTLSHIRSRYLLGFTCDEMRNDGLQNWISEPLGGIVWKVATQQGPSFPRVARRMRRTMFSFAYEGREDYPKMLKALSSDEQRNAIIAEDVSRSPQQSGHVLILSERKDHLQHLAAHLSDLPICIVTSGTPPAKRKTELAAASRDTKTIVLCTGHLAQEVLQAIPISRIFLVFPFRYARRLEEILTAALRETRERSLYVHDYDDVQIRPLHQSFLSRSQTIARVSLHAEQDYRRWAQTTMPF